ncbi:hypothetical protein POSPLADRAFT_1152876 [Postia placenta MAD-698-R-SB12]|uniref:AMP-dependent synthetase/ligase domain-containing protein n=1 Tax=Postia placenta MAD-698-R-SB12 TaxID=670580 RepID=A0A1X6MQZ9_9APHY|nr:hypothetical protein POSPLADRAFT_1152876 [Postia placenta MAD-698-R-SB12]OSX58583.1 hypothetical protein POSPLADRAFT_1152876 [Postia placenta MAD-698-R-SB12]
MDPNFCPIPDTSSHSASVHWPTCQEPSLSFGPEEPIPYRCIQNAFCAQAAANPEHTAVVDHYGQSLTYKQLDVLSLHLALNLRGQGVTNGSRVCLLIERSNAYIIAILAVLRAGAAYIPLDGGGLTIVFALTAYLSLSSGTTGQPKGVIIKHLGLTNLLCLYPGNLGVKPGVHVAQLLNVAFDMCAWEILACLMNGGTLHLRGPHRADWISVMKTVDVVICTPSILQQHRPQDFPNLKVVATGGEPISQALADQWAAQATIGTPTPNSSVYVLDDDLMPVARGRKGTMWAGGLGVCQGYLKRPSLNEIKFKPDPFSHKGGLMFNTGDLGVMKEDGSLVHMGRSDDQVKVKGFRVELDGVSAAIRACPGVVSACALLIKQDIWAFYTPPHIAIEDVRIAIARTQPYYAVPTQYKALSSIPLTR